MAAAAQAAQLKDVFGVFNNKGGVGKTTLSFQIVCDFAEKHPDDVIVVADMCPQANLSQLLLTEAKITAGSFSLRPGDQRVKARADELDVDSIPKTVAGVLAGSRTRGWLGATNFKENFLIQARSRNPNVPENIFLLCGDATLDTLAPTMAREAFAPAAIGDSFYDVHTCLAKFFEKMPGEFGKNVYGFVDTNPALTIYTHMALVASKKLIVPLLADDFSAVAVNEIFSRVYGTTGVKENALHSMASESFEHKIKTPRYSRGPLKIELPKIHMVIMNRTDLASQALAHYSNPGYEKAKLMMGEHGFFGNCFKEGEDNFTQRGVPIDPSTDWVTAQDPFMTNYLFFMSDLKQAATVASLGGAPIGKLTNDKDLKKRLKAELNAKGCSTDMLKTAKLFLGYIVDHMTADRAEMDRRAEGTIKHHLIPHDHAFPPVPPADGGGGDGGGSGGDSGDEDDDDDDHPGSPPLGETADSRAARAPPSASKLQVAKDEDATAHAASLKSASMGPHMTKEQQEQALKNYEKFHRLQEGTATLDQVKNSSAGLVGWARSGAKKPAAEKAKGATAAARAPAAAVSPPATPLDAGGAQKKKKSWSPPSPGAVLMKTATFPKGISGKNQEIAQAAVGKTEVQMKAAGWQNKHFKFFIEKKPNLRWASESETQNLWSPKRKQETGGEPGGKRAKA